MDEVISKLINMTLNEHNYDLASIYYYTLNEYIYFRYLDEMEEQIKTEKIFSSDLSD